MQTYQENFADLSPWKTIEDLINEAKGSRRRATDRHSFFRPVTVTIESGAGKSYSVFSRDISDSGIGLLHNMPLECEEVSLTIGSNAALPVHLRAKIEWCKPCGEGWYISGGRFLGY